LLVHLYHISPMAFETPRWGGTSPFPPSVFFLPPTITPYHGFSLQPKRTPSFGFSLQPKSTPSFGGESSTLGGTYFGGCQSSHSNPLFWGRKLRFGRYVLRGVGHQYAIMSIDFTPHVWGVRYLSYRYAMRILVIGLTPPDGGKRLQCAWFCWLFGYLHEPPGTGGT
jgi:hypothetical protein